MLLRLLLLPLLLHEQLNWSELLLLLLLLPLLLHKQLVDLVLLHLRYLVLLLILQLLLLHIVELLLHVAGLHCIWLHGLHPTVEVVVVEAEVVLLWWMW